MPEANQNRDVNKLGQPGPRGADGPPPSHEETLGALQGVPKDVAEAYAETGRTPKAHVRRVVKTEQEAERAGLNVNPGLAAQPYFHEDTEEAVKESDRARKQGTGDAGARETVTSPAQKTPVDESAEKRRRPQ